ncbi:hypothetical protein FQA47_005080 [Oryzias melastigma]|uniref:Uncharacterized protein n=1 Tax=Oryzias melastigma TaxID=30732 RepID=A0A834BR39_ORYME|nr:hypothetical protein FQA47_005080 [Oryzias melastigma]
MSSEKAAQSPAELREGPQGSSPPHNPDPLQRNPSRTAHLSPHSEEKVSFIWSSRSSSTGEGVGVRKKQKLPGSGAELTWRFGQTVSAVSQSRLEELDSRTGPAAELNQTVKVTL